MTWPVGQALRGVASQEPCCRVLPVCQGPTAGPLLIVVFLGLCALSPTLPPWPPPAFCHLSAPFPLAMLVSLKHSFLPRVCRILVHPRWAASGAGSAHQSNHCHRGGIGWGRTPARPPLAPCPHEASLKGAF